MKCLPASWPLNLGPVRHLYLLYRTWVRLLNFQSDMWWWTAVLEERKVLIINIKIFFLNRAILCWADQTFTLCACVRGWVLCEWEALFCREQTRGVHDAVVLCGQGGSLSCSSRVEGNQSRVLKWIDQFLWLRRMLPLLELWILMWGGGPTLA